tara:strand:- start:281 stop:415 length:135 start_codon:yes stop_codon:yes gene_type:complete
MEVQVDQLVSLEMVVVELEQQVVQVVLLVIVLHRELAVQELQLP